MPTRVGWGPGVEEWKLHLWEFWKRCVSLKWASVQHTQKINSLPSSHLSELPLGLSQEILHKGSLFVHPFYNENAFVYIFKIWKQFSGSCSPDLQCLKWVSPAAAASLENGWMNAWTLLPGVFQSLPLNQSCDLTTLMYHCYRRNRKNLWFALF